MHNCLFITMASQIKRVWAPQTIMGSRLLSLCEDSVKETSMDLAQLVFQMVIEFINHIYILYKVQGGEYNARDVSNKRFFSNFFTYDISHYLYAKKRSK